MAKIKEISLKFGLSYGTIKDRLQEQGFMITDKDADLFEKFRHSINMLAIYNYITKSQAEKIYKKLAENIAIKAIPIEREEK